MSASPKFKFIEKSLIDILLLIVSNQNILRYIKYLNNDPLDPSLPNIQDNLINTNIILAPFDKNIVEVSEVKLFFYPLRSDLKSKALGKHIYMLDIICPIEYFLLDGRGEIRVIRIADEITQMIDQKHITGIGELTIPEAFLSRLNNDTNYIIYSLPIEINSTSVKS